MADNIGLRLTLDGQAEFNRAIKEMNQTFKVLGSEMSVIASRFDKNDRSMLAYTEKNKVLAREIEELGKQYSLISAEHKKQTDTLNELNTQLEKTKTEYGENSKETAEAERAYKKQVEAVNALIIALNKTEASTNKVNSEISDNARAIEDAAHDYDEAKDEVIEFGNEVSKVSEKTSVFGDVLKANFVSDIIIGGIRNLTNSIRGFVNNGISIVNKEFEAQAKLQQVMKNTMSAVDGEVKAIIELTNAQSRLGVVSAGAQQAGSQELATYLSKSESLQRLIPVMNDVLAQQYGYNASQENAVTIATMLGKVMDGQTGALSRYGYTFTDAQAQILEFGAEAERVAVLAEVISDSVGGMNEALGETDAGKMLRAGADIENTQKTIARTINEVKSTIVSGLLPSIEKVTTKTSDFINRNKEPLMEFAEEVSSFIEYIIDNAGYVASAITGISAAYGALKVAGVIQGITSAYKAWTTATTTQTIVQTGLNTATLAFPGMALAAAIGTAVFALGNVVTAVSKAKKAQEDYNNTVERFNKIKLEGIQQSEIAGYEDEISKLEELKQKYDNLVNLARTMQEEASTQYGYDPLAGGDALFYFDDAAKALGISLRDLEKDFEANGLAAKSMYDSYSDGAKSVKEMETRTESARLAIQRAGIDITKYFGELDNAARKEIANNKEVLTSWNEVLNGQIASLNEQIRVKQEDIEADSASLTQKELIRQAIAELISDRDKLSGVIQDNTKTLDDLTKIEKGEYEQTAGLTDKNNKLAHSYELLRQMVLDESDSINSLENAYRKLQDGGQLSIDQLLEFIELYPEVAEYIAKTSDITLDHGEILAIAAQERRRLLIEEMELQADTVRENIKSLEAQAQAAVTSYETQIEAMQAHIAAVGAYGAAELFRSNADDIAEQKRKAEEFNLLIEEQQQILNEQEAKIAALKQLSDYGGTSAETAVKEKNEQKEKNELLDDELEKLSQKKRLGELAASDELDWQIQIAERYAKTDKERTDAKIRVLEAVNALTEQELKNAAQLRADGKITAQEEIDRINNISSEYEALINKYNLAAVKQADITAQYAEAVKAVYQDEYEAIQHAGKMGEDVSQALLGWYDKALSSGAYTAKELTRMAEERYKEEQRLAKISADEINQLGTDLSAAIKNRYQDQKTVALKAIDDELAAVKSASREKMGMYDAEYAAKMKLIDDEESARLSAIQAEIDALDEKTKAEDKARREQDYQDRLEELKEKFQKATTNDDRKDIQKEVNRLAESRQREVTLEQRNERKAELKQQLDDEKEALKAARIELEKSKLEELDIRKTAISEQFDELMSAEAIQGEALKTLIEGQQDDIIALLESYYPEWANAGKKFSDFLIEGINTENIKQALNSTLSAVGSVSGTTAKGVGSQSNVTSYDGRTIDSSMFDAGALISGIKPTLQAILEKMEPYLEYARSMPSTLNEVFKNATNQCVSVFDLGIDRIALALDEIKAACTDEGGTNSSDIAITINVNNPTVRNDNDSSALAKTIARELQLALNGRGITL